MRSVAILPFCFVYALQMPVMPVMPVKSGVTAEPVSPEPAQQIEDRNALRKGGKMKPADQLRGFGVLADGDPLRCQSKLVGLVCDAVSVGLDGVLDEVNVQAGFHDVCSFLACGV